MKEATDMTVWTMSRKHLLCDCGVETMPVDDEDGSNTDPAMIIARTAVYSLMNGMMLSPAPTLTPADKEFFVCLGGKPDAESPEWLLIVHRADADVAALFAKVLQSAQDAKTLAEMEEMMNQL